MSTSQENQTRKIQVPDKIIFKGAINHVENIENGTNVTPTTIKNYTYSFPKKQDLIYEM